MNHLSTETPTLSIPIFFQLQEEERYRLAHALMDGPGQILANALVELENSLRLVHDDPVAAVAGISALRNEIRTGLSQLRTFVAELQPPLLDELGLGACLKEYVQAFGAKNGVRVECVGCDTMGDRLPSTIEIAVFRIVQEALANVRAHSGATHVRVKMERVADLVRLEVRDNGRGFVTTEEAVINRRQLGLVGMYDRAKLIGGQLQIFSEPHKGTRVVLTVPYHSHDEDLDASRGGK